MGAHSKARIGAAKPWILPAIGTAFAVAGPGVATGGGTLAAPADTGALGRTAAVANSTHLSLGPNTRTDTPEFAALQAKKDKKVPETGVEGRSRTRSTSSSRASRSTARIPVRQTTRKPLSGSRVDRVVAAAESILWAQYKWGGNDPATGVDCSGFVNYAFNKVGVRLPRVSRDIYSSLVARGGRISASQARAGDLFFLSSGGRIHHVGIVGKGGWWLHARNPRMDVAKTRPNPGRSDAVLYARVL